MQNWAQTNSLSQHRKVDYSHILQHSKFEQSKLSQCHTKSGKFSNQNFKCFVHHIIVSTFSVKYLIHQPGFWIHCLKLDQISELKFQSAATTIPTSKNLLRCRIGCLYFNFGWGLHFRHELLQQPCQCPRKKSMLILVYHNVIVCNCWSSPSSDWATFNHYDNCL